MKVSYQISCGQLGDGDSICLWRVQDSEMIKIARFQTNGTARLFADEFGFPLSDALKTRVKKDKPNMRILYLTIKKKWFDMIVSGEKREAYREIKPYWQKRFENKKYDVICFRNGHAKIYVELENITTSLGRTMWGAPEGKPVYVLRFGAIKGML